jgi:transposase
MSFSENEKKRVEIIRLFKEKFSRRKIASKMNISASTVIKVIKNYLDRGITDRKKGSGRRGRLGDAETSLIKKSISVDNKISATKVADIIQEKVGKTVSQWTISRKMRSMGFFSRSPALKPYLTSAHKKERLRLSLKWSRWPKRKFKRIIYSDECRFSINGNDGAQRIRRLPGTRYDEANIIGTKKYGGGGVMAWGCISYEGVGRLVVTDTTMDSISYTRLLAEYLHESAEIMGLFDDFVFQQDNAPCHTSAHTRKFFEENDITVLEWPAQSPDLNPIEHVWAHIKKELKKFAIKNKPELVIKIKEIWNNIPKEHIRKIIDSMPQRIEEVIRAKGGNTSY